MKTFTTSIYVPHQTKAKMNLIDTLELAAELNNPVSLPSDLYHGGLDEVEVGEEFILIVNGTHHKHEIKMRGCNKVGGKVRFMFVDPSDEATYRLAEWRIKSVNLMKMKNGAELQLRNFGAQELRRLIRHSVAKRERNLVTYR